MTAEETLARLDEFQKPTKDATLGVRKDAVWLHIPLTVDPASDGRWVLEINHPDLNRIDVLLLQGGKVLQRSLLGGQHVRGEVVAMRHHVGHKAADKQGDVRLALVVHQQWRQMGLRLRDAFTHGAYIGVDQPHAIVRATTVPFGVVAVLLRQGAPRSRELPALRHTWKARLTSGLTRSMYSGCLWM